MVDKKRNQRDEPDRPAPLSPPVERPQPPIKPQGDIDNPGKNPPPPPPPPNNP